IKYEFREQLLDEVVKHFCSDDEIFDALYLNERHLEKMQLNKMIIGAHSFNHLNFLKLNKEEQFEEVNKSFKTLDKFLNPLKTFCYPYGEFNVDSKEILEKLNCDFAFVSLDYYKKDITLKDLKYNPYTLSRYDCNEFQFGQAN
ncbi:polysaccharide deacetylase family protein, partial [Campylobacter sp. TTU-622]|uniref:polysaccharide deacetylase family protein n=1 Tax=Campylobacter sp. TTU-622 TaxID=2800583 RepID=UPI001904B430